MVLSWSPRRPWQHSFSLQNRSCSYQNLNPHPTDTPIPINHPHISQYSFDTFDTASHHKITITPSPGPQVPRSPVPSPVAVSMQPGPVGSGPAPASAPGSKPGRRSPSCAAPWSRRCPSCDLEKDRCGLIDRIYIATVDGWIDGWMDRLNDQKGRRTTKRTKMTKRTEITEITKRTKKTRKSTRNKKHGEEQGEEPRRSTRRRLVVA